MTIARDQRADAQNQAPDDGEGERPGLIRRLRVPLLFLAACLLGFVLEFGVGLPGTPVWAGVIVAEVVIGVSARTLARRKPASEPPAPQATGEPHDPPTAPSPAEPERPRARTKPRALPKPPPEPPAPERPEPAAAPLPPLRAVRPAPPPPPPPPEPVKPVRKPARAARKDAVEETLESAVDAARESAPASREPPARIEPAAPAAAAPADPEQSWAAEILWRESGQAGVFLAVARNPAGDTATVGEARVAAGPLRGPGALEELGRAVEALETALLAAGWAPAAAPPGGAWYARRFTWSPGGATAADVGDRPRAGLPREWPDGTAELVRCQLEWQSRYRSSRFTAVVYRPGEKRGKEIGASEPFRWMVGEPPDWRDPDQLAAVRTLRAALIADGWEEIGEGTVWYGRRFVWRGDADPPERLGAS